MSIGVAAIMAPTYLPWIGYFDMIDRSDIFVFLDSVQFKKRSWQQRNRIRGPNGELWLTVPVLSKGKYEQLISEVVIDPTVRFQDKHIKNIIYSYRKAPFFEQYIDGLSEIIRVPYERLIDLNMNLIDWFCTVLGIDKSSCMSSDIEYDGKKGELLASICSTLEAKCYLSASGSRPFIEENDQFTPNGIRLEYHDYRHPQYRQGNCEFIPYLSIMDLLFNEGPVSLSIIRKGRLTTS